MPILTTSQFVETYDPPQEEYKDGHQLELVTDYQRVQNYIASNPYAGRATIGNALGLPASRVRHWKEGQIPDAIRGLHRAEENEWLPLEYDSHKLKGGINVLVAWIYSSGSITRRNFTPRFAASNPRELTDVKKALDVVGVQYSVLRENDSNRATEIQVSRDSTVLGRILAALGAPVGEKNRENDIHLPAYLNDAPREIRLEFAQIYLSNRLSQTEGRTVAQFREERTRDYHEELAAFLRDALDIAVKRSDMNIYLSEWPAEIPRT